MPLANRFLFMLTVVLGGCDQTTGVLEQAWASRDRDGQVCISLGTEFPDRVSIVGALLDSQVDWPAPSVLNGLVRSRLVVLNEAQGAASAGQLHVDITKRAVKLDFPGSEGVVCIGRPAVRDVTEVPRLHGDNENSKYVEYEVELVDTPSWLVREDFASLPGMTKPISARTLMRRVDGEWVAERTTVNDGQSLSGQAEQQLFTVESGRGPAIAPRDWRQKLVVDGIMTYGVAEQLTGQGFTVMGSSPSMANERWGKGRRTIMLAKGSKCYELGAYYDLSQGLSHVDGGSTQDVHPLPGARGKACKEALDIYEEAFAQ